MARKKSTPAKSRSKPSSDGEAVESRLSLHEDGTLRCVVRVHYKREIHFFMLPPGYCIIGPVTLKLGEKLRR